MIFIILAFLALFGCQPTPGPAPMPLPVDDAGADPCGSACSHLRSLRCPDGDPTPAGTTCEAVCETDRADPIARLTSRYLACIARVPACSDEDRCAR